MGRRRRERRVTDRVELVTKGGPVGPRIKGWILVTEGEKMVKDGRAVRVLDVDTNGLLGYQLSSSEVASKPAKPTIQGSQSVLSEGEVELIVGQNFKGGPNIDFTKDGPPGKSQTLGLSQQQRKLREAVGMDPVDGVEAALIKLDAFDPRHGRVVVELNLSAAA